MCIHGGGNNNQNVSQPKLGTCGAMEEVQSAYLVLRFRAVLCCMEFVAKSGIPRLIPVGGIICCFMQWLYTLLTSQNWIFHKVIAEMDNIMRFAVVSWQ